QLVAAGPLPPRPGLPPGRAAPPLSLPEHCLVQGALAPRTGAGGKHYQIGFQMRLPTQWSGRFLYQGGGGTDGIVQPAIGPVGVDQGPALARGFAVVSTDSGHQGFDTSFGFDQQARLDFGYAAIGKVTAEAKHMVERFYGRQPRYSYFVGCSNGGREAMMAAQRFPYDFDGIVAGDPGFDLSAAAVEEIWDVDQFVKVAPRDAQGKPVLSAAFTGAELKLVSTAVLRQCDRLDGLVDGMINDVGACHFDPAVLECRAGASSDCLSAAKVAALRAVFGGARNSAGHSLYPGFPYDAGIATPGWRVWKIGSSKTAASNAINATLGLSAVQDYFLTPTRPDLSTAAFSFDRDAPQVAQTAAINDATSTFMTSFVAHHGRMLIYQGMSDPVFSAADIMRWYRQLMHDVPGAADWARLFLVPGMNHCGGGPSTDQFDPLTAIVGWTEHGTAPDRLIARGSSMPGLTRPLCPYPQYARYTGGDPKSAASFACRN
ncbi:MAG: tannase/feruloyl esterase family alpha/beta hydrolase, partial [Steroidobacteraceae bacterium]